MQTQKHCEPPAPQGGKPAGIILRWVFGILIGVLFVWLSARQWPMEGLLCDDVTWTGDELRCMSDGQLSWALFPLWLLPAFGVLVAVHFLRVLRWRPLMNSLGWHSFPVLNRICAISFMLLFIMPLRLGELVRPFLAATYGKVRKSEVLGTVVLERVLDGVMMAFLLFCVLALLPAGNNPAAYYSLRVGSLLALLVFVSALVCLCVAFVLKDRLTTLTGRLFGHLSPRLGARLQDMTCRFIEGLKALPSPLVLVDAVFWTAVYWGVNGFYFFFMARAFGLGAWVGPEVAYAMMAAAAVGMMIPNSPANLGSFWYFLLLPMYVSGMPAGSAPIAFGIMVWALMLLQYCLFGLIWYKREDLKKI